MEAAVMDRPRVSRTADFTPPERSVQQRRAALLEANRIRSVRAAWKRDLKAGRLQFSDVVNHPDAATMKVWDVILAMPKWGRVKVDRLLRKRIISPSKTCGGLSERQRRELLDVLG